jgi:hypothetical protein
MEKQLGFQGLAILLILLPGFLCAGLVRALFVRPAQTELDKVWEALLYSFVIFVIFVGLSGSAIPFALRMEEQGGVHRYGVELQPWPLTELALISVGLALAVGGILTNDILGKLLRKLRLTQRTSRSSVWSDTFHEYYGVVLVELEDGRRVEGWLLHYSDEPDPASLFLGNAAWVTDDQTLVPIEGAGILITQKLGIRTIEFLRWTDQSNEPAKSNPGLAKVASPELERPQETP